MTMRKLLFISGFFVVFFTFKEVISVPLESVVLGQVEYFGEAATAVREMYQDCWKFVIVTNTDRYVLAHY